MWDATRFYHRASTNDRSRVQNRVASHIGVVSDHRPELSQTGIERLPLDIQHDISWHQFHIGNLHSGAQVGIETENGVAHIPKMRHLRFVEEKRVLKFARISDDAAVSHNHIFPQVGIVPNLTVSTNDRRSFDHHAILDHSAFADEHLLANMGLAIKLRFAPRFEIGLQIILELLESVPGVATILEQGRVLGLRQVEKIGWCEHRREKYANHLPPQEDKP